MVLVYHHDKVCHTRKHAKKIFCFDWIFYIITCLIIHHATGQGFGYPYPVHNGKEQRMSHKACKKINGF